jgi:hypothetical protein
MWFEVVIIEVDGDILCFLLVEIVCATKQPLHLENINDNQAEAGTLHIVDYEYNSWATELMNRLYAMHKHVSTCFTRKRTADGGQTNVG